MEEIINGPVLIEIKSKYIDIDKKWYLMISYVSYFMDDTEHDNIVIKIVDIDYNTIINVSTNELFDVSVIFTDDFIQWSKTISGYEMLCINYSIPSMDEIRQIMSIKHDKYTVLIPTYR